MIRCDFHIHTCYCDGKDTPAEIAAQAAAQGPTAIGFSGHSFLSVDPCAMSERDTLRYRSEIAALKEKYRGTMTILCGLEKDLFSSEREEDFDYSIGSVHFLFCHGEYFPVDHNVDAVKSTIRDHFSGDPYAYAAFYYRQVSRLFHFLKPDMIGHFDLVTKFQESEPLWDPEDDRYRKAWQEAADALLPFEKPFEINTGAISRGIRKAPYPSAEILSYLNKHGARIILSSDSHRKETLCFDFAEARELAIFCGFRSQWIPDGRGGLTEIPL